MKPTLSIIIVSFNTKDFLCRCLESLDSNDEIIVVDNGSTDGSTEYLRDLEQKRFRSIEKTKEFSKSLNVYNSIALKVIFNNQNLGFAKAVNQGLKQAKGDYLLLLNSDIIVKPDSINKLIEFAEKHSEAGVIGGKLLNPDNSFQGSCFHLPTLLKVMKEFWFKGPSVLSKYALSGDKPVEVEAVIGAVFLIPRKIMEEIGFLDERYFMYFEDLDYCRRVGKAGYKVYYLPEAEFVHAHGASGKNISNKTHKWLVESSKIYHGWLNYYLISLIIWIGQKWQKFIK